ncbi:MAG TPA: dTDP-glucose 4,6-dehydratase [Planctomycetaceae bacterium]|nr:dTDP-glucose 4,6-dehydratase [Planctomycetaceae bacterium]
MEVLLVTGGAGFIGACFVRKLLSGRKSRVVNLDRLTYAGNLDSLAPVMGRPEHVFVHGDICDAKLVRRLLREHQPEAVVNFAAESHVDRSIEGPGEFLKTNVIGTFTLLEAALDYWSSLDGERRSKFRFLQISTDEVYGSLGPTGRFHETSTYAPNSPYSASKAAADHFVRAYHRTYGLPTLITHSSNNYGPYQFPEKLIPLMVLNALEGRLLPVYGDGQNVRDWLFVEDHCDALWAVLLRGRPGETYNIGGDCEKTNIEVVRAICSVVDELRPDLPHRPCTSLITFVEDRPGHDRRYAIDSSTIRTEVGWKPRHDFRSGLRATVQWYLNNRPWVDRVTSGVYRRERLGLSRQRVRS